MGNGWVLHFAINHSKDILMKTNTTVPVADYLELYEFKKAYDEGKRFIVKVNYGELTDRVYMAPKEELTAEMQVLINEYRHASENWQSEEEVQAEIERLKQEIEGHELGKLMVGRLVDQAVLEKVSVEKKLKSTKKIVLYLTIAWVVAMITILTLL